MQAGYTNKYFIQDCLVAVAIIVVTSVLMVKYEFWETWYQYTRAHESWELDEYFCVLVAILIACTVLWVRHSKRLKKALHSLQESQDQLENNKKEEYRRKKMAALGQLASGMAHEINNALQPVLGLSDIIATNTPADNRLIQDSASMIHENALHMRMIVQNVLSFSRGNETDKQTGPALTMIRETLDFSVELLPSSLEFIIGYEDNAENFLADQMIHINRTGLIQVFTNFLTNSAYAMQNEGTIHVLIGLRHVERHPKPIGKLKPGSYASVMIRDTGCGMEKTTLERIFEPFYTTKPEGEGTGLGLSTAYGIVNGWGGDVMVTSELGKGTDITFYIPLIGKHESSVEAA